MRGPLGLGCFLLPVSFELSQDLLRIRLFRLPNLLSQPLQFGELFEQIW